MLRPGGLPTPAWADGDRTASGGWSWPPQIRAPCRTRPPGTWSPTWPGPAAHARKTAPGRLPAWPRSCACTASGTGSGKAASRSRTSWAGPTSRSAPMSRSAATRPWSTARSHFAGPPGSPNTRRSMTRHRSPGPAAERGGADAAVPPPPAPSWPGAARDPRLAFPLDRAAALVAGMVQGAPAPAAASPDQLGRGRLRPAPLHPELTDYRYAELTGLLVLAVRAAERVVGGQSTAALLPRPIGSLR